jgi:hypothetical protein
VTEFWVEGCGCAGEGEDGDLGELERGWREGEEEGIIVGRRGLRRRLDEWKDGWTDEQREERNNPPSPNTYL